MSINKNEIIEALQRTGHYNKNETYDIEMLEDKKVVTGCNSCGQCCRNRNDILLKPIDIYKMSKELNISPIQLINKYCEVYIGETSKLPVVSVKFRDNLFDKTTICPFLKKVNEKTYHCRIHNSKPGVCKIYPLGRINSGNDNETMYFKQPITCVKKEDQKEYTFEEWLGEDYKLQEDFFAEFYEIVNYIDKKINLKKIWQVADKKKETPVIMSLLLSILYVPDITLDINESLNQYKNRKSIIDEVVEILRSSGYNVIKK